MNIVLIGKPGSGKGTLSPVLKGYNIITAGDLIRSIRNDVNNPLSKMVSSIIDGGNLLPDNLTNDIIKSHLSGFKIGSRMDPKFQFMFDGYPRTMQQAKFLDSIVNIDLCVYIDVSDETCMKRIINRGLTSGREDDQNEEIVKTRLKNYYDQTVDLIKYYRLSKRLMVLNGEEDVDAVKKSFLNNLRKIEYNS